MQTQLDVSLSDALLFHSIDVGVFTIISTITLFTNNVPKEVAYAIVIVYIFCVLMDGMSLIFVAIIKYLSIFYRTLLDDYDEKKIKRLSRFIIAFASVVLLITFDLTSLENNGYIAYLTGTNEAPTQKANNSTNFVFALVAIVHFALICRIEARNFKYEEGILYLVIKKENVLEFVASNFFNRIFALMTSFMFVVFIISYVYFEEIYFDTTRYLPRIGYVHALPLVQFWIVDVILVSMLLKNLRFLKKVYQNTLHYFGM